MGEARRSLYDHSMNDMDRIHTHLLTSAARQILRPHGLFQKGRSRTWLADQGWWLAVVEFQPSGFGRGSYLNVGCMWLWNVSPNLSFDIGYRVEEFHPFESPQQFEPVAARLANRALQRVAEYRRLLPTVREASEYYSRNTPKDFWPLFNASVAHSLAGLSEIAEAALVPCVHDELNDPAWLTGARRAARELLAVIGDRKRLTDLVADRVRQTRDLHKLRRLEEIDFERECIASLSGE